MTAPRIGSLFTGYGGLDLAVEAVTGGRTVWVSDIDPGARKILAHNWPDVPNLGDITRIDWDTVEPVDIITGGSPCQDLSLAGKRGGMTVGTRSNLWVSMREAIAKLRPGLVVWENVRGAYSATADSEMEHCAGCVGDTRGRSLRALGRVLGDLADLGYDAAWHGLPASDVGAPHGRFRCFLISWPTTDPASVGRGEGITEPAGIVGGSNAGPGSAGLAPDPYSAGSQGREYDPRVGGGEPVRYSVATTHTGSEELARWTRPRTDQQGRFGGARSGHGGLFDIPTGSIAGPGFSWGGYGPAVHQWEAMTRDAPPPTMGGRRGSRQLAPRFVEWMMGLPDGHVTGVPGLDRVEQLHALGNGVVPEQAEAALRHLFEAVA